MALRKFSSVEIGNNIRRIRIECDYTQAEFGKVVGGYSQDTVAKWEAGQVPHAPVLIKIADIGKKSVDWILNREGVQRVREERELIDDLKRTLAELSQRVQDKETKRERSKRRAR